MDLVNGLAEQPRSEFLNLSAKCCGSRDLEYLAGRETASQQDASHKESDFCRKRAIIDMSFVHHKSLQSPPEKCCILRAAQHILQHRVIGDEDVRDVKPRLLPRSHSATFKDRI